MYLIPGSKHPSSSVGSNDSPIQPASGLGSLVKVVRAIVIGVSLSHLAGNQDYKFARKSGGLLEVNPSECCSFLSLLLSCCSTFSLTKFKKLLCTCSSQLFSREASAPGKHSSTATLDVPVFSDSRVTVCPKAIL